MVSAVRAMAIDTDFLHRHGLSTSDFELALPAAIERIRGSAAASNSDRRTFLKELFTWLESSRSISGFDTPQYGADTVYRLEVPTLGSIAIIQKGCPDGAHSSVNWTTPEWAHETYLWWLCDSLQYEPGEHIAKGVNRLRNRFFSTDYSDAIDGIIFHNATCATAQRPCPKMHLSVEIEGRSVPPPCIWIMPKRENLETTLRSEWNWQGERVLQFPAVLLSAFGIESDGLDSYQGYVGFSRNDRGTRSTIASRFGPGRSTMFRSEPR